MDMKIEVHTSELSKCADRIEKDLQDLSTYVNQLYNDNLYQLGTGWKSKDNQEFINRFTDYLEDLQRLGDSVSDYIAFLRVAQQSYDSALSESASEVKGGL